MEAFQQFAVVIFVLALLIGLALCARNRGIAHIALPSRSSRSRHMESIERLSLSPNHSLHMVSIDGKTVLLGISPSGCQLIEPREVAK
jgi:flagellar biogenesis protein FliO